MIGAFFIFMELEQIIEEKIALEGIIGLLIKEFCDRTGIDKGRVVAYTETLMLGEFAGDINTFKLKITL